MLADALDLPPLALGAAPALNVAPWHAARPHLLANAMERVREHAPAVSGLAARILPRLPRRVLTSRNIRAVGVLPSSGTLLLDDAALCPWISLNHGEAINALAWDVDHDDGLDLVADLPRGCPRPWLVQDPWSGRAHAFLFLRTPVVTRDGALLGPRILADLAARLMGAALRATPLPQVALVKNPLGLAEALDGERLLRGVPPTVLAGWRKRQQAAADARDEAIQESHGLALPALWQAYQAANTGLMWHTVPGDEPCELRAIVAALADLYADEAPAPTRRRFRNRGEPSALGRNCALFDLTRWWAYDRCERSADAILAEAERVNGSFPESLPRSEVRATAASIHRFMVRRFRAGASTPDARRGRDRVAGAELAPAARKAVAGKVTAAARAAATDARIASAVAVLLAAGCPLTQSAIAAEAGVGLNTVARRWSREENPPNAALSGSAPCAPRGSAPPQDSEKESLRALARRDRRSRPLLVALAAAGPADDLPAVPADLACLPAVTAALSAATERRTRLLLASLAAVAEAAQRPGADPGVLPAVPPDLARFPEIRRALHTAEAAQADARRRAGARAARAAAAARREGYVALLRAGRAGAWRRWREESDALDQEWDYREHEADSRELPRVRARRQAAFAARWMAWDAALRVVGGHPPRRRRRAEAVAADAIPWSHRLRDVPQLRVLR